MKGLFKKIGDKISKITDALFSDTSSDNTSDAVYVLSVRVFQLTTNNGQVFFRTVRELYCSAFDERVTTNDQLMKKILKEDPIQTDSGIYITPQSVSSIKLVKDITKIT